MLQLNPDGKIFPCCSFRVPEPLANINEKSLYDVWNSDTLRNFQLNMLDAGAVGMGGICEKCNYFKYIMIILSTRDRGNVGLKTYASANDVFNDLAWHLTLMGSIIARCDSLLKDVDFDYLRKKYMTDLCSAFSHVGLYLEQAAKLDRFSAVHLPPYRSRFRNSPIKSASGWYKNRFHVWAKCWTKTVLRLPRCFANKQVAICTNGERSGVLREESLCWSRARGVLNLVVFLSYLTRWKRITEYPACGAPLAAPGSRP